MKFPDPKTRPHRLSVEYRQSGLTRQLVQGDRTAVFNVYHWAEPAPGYRFIWEKFEDGAWKLQQTKEAAPLVQRELAALRGATEALQACHEKHRQRAAKRRSDASSKAAQILKRAAQQLHIAGFRPFEGVPSLVSLEQLAHGVTKELPGILDDLATLKRQRDEAIGGQAR